MTDDKIKRDNPDHRKSADSGEADYLVDRKGHVFKVREPDHDAGDDRQEGRSHR